MCDIPVPASDATRVHPDIAIAPVIGFDEACYRLENGGGYFDRTLAALSPRPTIIGVGYARSAIPTIHPLPHNIPMDVIITEQGILNCRGYVLG
ncbi:MAG: 5-formyltetrahydrofolate cyclo-ligase [Steroidobacteraceae bacterium]